MNLIIGVIVVLGSVVGGYLASHGHMLALWQPFELVIIGGAALGGFIIANPMHLVIKTFKSVPSLLGGSKYSKTLYMDVLALMFDIFNKTRKEGMMAIEDDVEEPEESEIFKKYPKLLGDHHVIEFITDYLRIIVGGNMNAFELENLMDIELETHHHEAEAPSHALTRVSDGLPGFGIVAAVLGIVITMGSLDGPASEIGAHVGAALVGTFLGILLAYGFVGPMATQLEARAAEESKFYQCIKVCMLATINGYSPPIAVEFGRKTLSSTVRPTFGELEKFLKENK
jgi:chemotaxis protein MotA